LYSSDLKFKLSLANLFDMTPPFTGSTIGASAKTVATPSRSGTTWSASVIRLARR